jgi:TPR repeat protein
MYYIGEGCRKDMFKAFDFFKEASDLGHSHSFFMMAKMIQKGEY